MFESEINMINSLGRLDGMPSPSARKGLYHEKASA
jgi:hypothetical protein